MENKVDRPNAIAVGRLFDAYDCYVLDDKTRVLSRNGLIRLLSGGARKRGVLEPYIDALPSRFRHLAVRANLEFIPPGGGTNHAVDVDTVVEICSAYADLVFAS